SGALYAFVPDESMIGGDDGEDDGNQEGNDSSDGGNWQKGVIIGGSVGGALVVFVFGIIFGKWVNNRKRMMSRRDEDADEEYEKLYDPLLLNGERRPIYLS